MRCSSYCVAEEYIISKLVTYLNEQGLEPQYFDDVVYFQKQHASEYYYYDIFVFPFGCISILGTNDIEEKAIIQELDFYTIDKYKTPSTDLVYYEYNTQESSSSEINIQETYIKEEENQIIIGDNSVFTKLSIAHALAQSVKLNVLEESVSNILKSTAPIRKELAKRGSVSLSKKQISKQIGMLFNERYSINMHSDILDTPEFFWRRPSYEPLYLMTAEFHDIQARHNILNHRLNMIHELYNILYNELNYKHSSKIELTIVILIAIEVSLALMHSDFWSKFLPLFN